MTANAGVSARGTSWDIIVTHPGFRCGFDHVRQGRDWEPMRAKHGRDWWWWYEHGRLFAASRYSHRWASMPSDRRKITPTLRKAVNAAHMGAVFPRTDGEWRAA